MSQFPKPWRAEYCGDCYRVYDANNLQLFTIDGDEYEDSEGNAQETVFFYGEAHEQEDLCAEIEKIFAA